MTILTQAHEQWASRPMDERFCSLDELVAATRKERQGSAEVIENFKRMALAAGPEGSINLVAEGRGDVVPVGSYAFEQMGYFAQAPVSYLRTLPAHIAAEAMNHGLKNRHDDVGLLVGEQGLRAVTGPKYGRIWNEEIAVALRDRFGDGVTGDWRVPGEFGKKVKVNKQNTTIYAGDRDMFVFLADETNRIEMPNRRNGKGGSLARGFFVWNSEVGARSFGIATFMFDYVCSNRIVWGASGFEQFTMKHTSLAPDKFLNEVTPMLNEYVDAEASQMRLMIEDARSKKIDTPVDEFLRKFLTKKDAVNVMAVHEAEEERPIETLWDASVGVTAFAKQIPNQDNRIWYERLGGKLIEMAV